MAPKREAAGAAVSKTEADATAAASKEAEETADAAGNGADESKVEAAGTSTLEPEAAAGALELLTCSSCYDDFAEMVDFQCAYPPEQACRVSVFVSMFHCI